MRLPCLDGLVVVVWGGERCLIKDPSVLNFYSIKIYSFTSIHSHGCMHAHQYRKMMLLQLVFFHGRTRAMLEVFKNQRPPQKKVRRVSHALPVHAVQAMLGRLHV